jgi:hypothetical protein
MGAAAVTESSSRHKKTKKKHFRLSVWFVDLLTVWTAFSNVFKNTSPQFSFLWYLSSVSSSLPFLLCNVQRCAVFPDNWPCKDDKSIFYRTIFISNSKSHHTRFILDVSVCFSGLHLSAARGPTIGITPNNSCSNISWKLCEVLNKW